MTIKSKPTITIWRSSLSKHGGLKNKVKDLFAKSNRFDGPFFVSRGGLKMSFNIAKRIVKELALIF